MLLLCFADLQQLYPPGKLALSPEGPGEAVHNALIDQDADHGPVSIRVLLLPAHVAAVSYNSLRDKELGWP